MSAKKAVNNDRLKRRCDVCYNPDLSPLHASSGKVCNEKKVNSDRLESSAAIATRARSLCQLTARVALQTVFKIVTEFRTDFRESKTRLTRSVIQRSRLC